MWSSYTYSHTHTHLDCGSESVLSFNSISEISVSRISGPDLFPYLEHRQKKESKGVIIKLRRKLTGLPTTHTFWLSSVKKTDLNTGK